MLFLGLGVLNLDGWMGGEGNFLFARRGWEEGHYLSTADEECRFSVLGLTKEVVGRCMHRLRLDSFSLLEGIEVVGIYPLEENSVENTN